MKTLSGIFSFLLFLSGNLSAQEKNLPVALKFAPAGFAVGKITFGGEYNVSRRNSVTFLAGVPFDKKQPITFDGEKSDVNSRAFSLMAGFRHYLGKKTMSGFYIEPYAKYLKHEASGMLNAVLQGQEVIFDTHSIYEGVGVGAQLGVQFIIAKLVVFDLFLLGPEVNSAKFNSVSTDITDNVGWNFADAQEAEQQIRDELKNIPLVGTKIEVTVNTSKKNVATHYAGVVPGLRAGASIGIRF